MRIMRITKALSVASLAHDGDPVAQVSGARHEPSTREIFPEVAIPHELIPARHFTRGRGPGVSKSRGREEIGESLVAFVAGILVDH